MILHHTCTACGHTDYSHSAATCSYGACACTADKALLSVPVLSPTFDETYRRVLTITPPGTRFPARGQGHITCACDACQVEFARLIA